MKECMETGKPKISILMAVYEPRMDWLREQLLSLDAQTYPNLKLYIRDDCSPTVSFEAVQSCVQDCIRAVPYEIQRNEKNLGSNGTFELLTKEADGDYFAYCDQDDIWLPEKLEKLAKQLAQPACTMSYCDMAVIDENGIPTADTLQEIRPRLRYVQGENIAEQYFFRNCTAGCSMLIRGEVARQAVPFLKNTVCDHWLAVCAAQKGRISFEEAALVLYRQHAHNQTGILHGVDGRESYRIRRLLPLYERLEGFERSGNASEPLKRFVYSRLEGKIFGIWKYRRFSSWEAAFEIMMHLAPEWVTKKCLGRLR